MAFIRTRQRKNGIKFYLVQKTGGIEKTVILPAKNWREANILLSQYESDLAGQTLNPLMLPKTIFRDFVTNKYLIYSKTTKANSTYSKDLSCVKTLILEWGHLNLDQITTDSINHAQEKWLKQDLNKKTINNRLILLGSILRQAMKLDLLIKLPHITKLKIDKKPPQYYSDEQIQTIFSKVRPFVKDFLLVFLHTGMRLSELQRLKWCDVDFKNKIITVMESKSHKFRSIPINQILESHLLELKQLSEKNQVYVFAGEKGGMFSDFYHAFVREMERIGMKGTLHMWRHTFASKLVQKGASIYIIKELLGHASVQTTQVYAHVRNEDLNKAVNLLND